MDKLIQLKPLMLSEKEVGSLAWDRVVKQHRNKFLGGCLLLMVLLIVPYNVNLRPIVQLVIAVSGLVLWTSWMYFYFNPRYQKIKKQLLGEWNKEVEHGKSVKM